MDSLFENTVFVNHVLRALSFTFLHSLWQGLILAVLVSGVLISFKKATPGVRYNIVAGALLAFMCITGFTFFKMMQPGGIASADPAADGTLLAGTGSLVRDLSQRVMNQCNANAPLIVAIWFVVFIVKSVNVMAGLVKVRRIRVYRNLPASAIWQERLQDLAQRLQLSVAVQLLESSLVQVPVVIGALKPVILLPIGLLSNLPPAQVEAILLHELAHIRRKDYLVNLLQSFAEVLFFFNPAVLWLSSLLRDEREHCCDDLAISTLNSKRRYIEALVGFQEYSTAVNLPVMAFPGTNDKLSDRVRRIVYNRRNSSSLLQRALLTVSVMVLACLLLVSTSHSLEARTNKHEIVSPQTKSNIMSVENIPSDSTGPKKKLPPLPKPPKPPKPVDRVKHAETGTHNKTIERAAREADKKKVAADRDRRTQDAARAKEDAALAEKLKN